jgi:hypothetical protein
MLERGFDKYTEVRNKDLNREVSACHPATKNVILSYYAVILQT